MCWFIGIYSKDNTDYSNDIKKGLEKIAHRGTSKTYSNNWNYTTGYTRLTTDGISSQETQYLETLLYNGIIYNTDFLKEKFKLKANNDFDSLILQEWYDSFWNNFVKHIRWMFAFAFQDDTTITLVRDSIGIKPLYYTLSDWICAFASEMKALVDICKEHNNKIVEVLPGEIIIFYKDIFQISKKIFSYSPSSWLTWEKLISDVLHSSLILPTRKYIQSWKKVAILLSGWLDSSVLLYSLFRDNEIKPENIVVFSMWIPGSSDYEATKIIEQDLGIEVVYLQPLSEEQSLHMIGRLVYITESPFSRVIKVSMFQYILASEIRKRDIDIVISGEWSDEIFYWYKRFHEWIKDSSNINKNYSDFFEKVFFYTLLQRLDRSFSHFTIEWRVPFLDQELVNGIRDTDIREKLSGENDKYILRKYAISLWMPESIVRRKKEKMTRGITSQENNYNNNLNGYLENICFHKNRAQLSDICKKYYKKYFHHQSDDLHSNMKDFLKEEDIITT